MAQKKTSIPIKALMLFIGFLMAFMLSSMTIYAAGRPTSASGYGNSDSHDLRRTTKYSFLTLGWTMHRMYGGTPSDSEYVAVKFNTVVTKNGRNFIAAYRRMNDAHILAEIEAYSPSWLAEMKEPGEHLVEFNSLMTWVHHVNGNKIVMGTLNSNGGAHGGLTNCGWPRGLNEAAKQYVSSFEDAYKNVPTKGIIYRWGWLHNTVQSSYTKDTSDNWWRARGSTNDVEDHYHWVHKFITVEDPKEERDTTEVRPLKVFDPDIKTYHYDTTYNVGEGIPSGKPITNGIYASHWRGDYVPLILL